LQWGLQCDPVLAVASSRSEGLRPREGPGASGPPPSVLPGRYAGVGAPS